MTYDDVIRFLPCEAARKRAWLGETDELIAKMAAVDDGKLRWVQSMLEERSAEIRKELDLIG